MPDVNYILKRELFPKLYRLKNGFWKKGLKVKYGGANVIISRIKVKQNGRNNLVHIGNDTRIINCEIHISGNNNMIYIGENCSLRGTVFYLENDNNEIRIENDSTTTNRVELCAIEGTKICIGEDCMISSDIYMSTGDGHSVCDKNGNRTNASKDIRIGNHVWVGTRVIIGKGFEVGDNSIIAAGSVCYSKSCNREENIIIGGNPARIVKRENNWLRNRIGRNE